MFALCRGGSRHSVTPNKSLRIYGTSVQIRRSNKAFIRKEHNMDPATLIDFSVWSTTALLVVTKIPDVVSTYGFVSRHGNPLLERNPLARIIFLKLGLVKGVVVLSFVYTIVSLIPLVIYLHLVGAWRSTWGIFFCLYGAFVCVVQLQVAWFNMSGCMPQTLRAVHRFLRWWYR